MKKSLIIIGSGGHAKVLLDALLLQHQAVLGFTDSNKDKWGTQIFGVSILGDDKIIEKYLPSDVHLALGIGANELKISLYKNFKKTGYLFPAIIHPQAVVSKLSTVINDGVQVMAGAAINPGCFLGENSIINTSASLDHDCHIANHVHIAPGVVLAGGVIIEESTYVGPGATIVRGVKIGKNCVIGAGTLVLQDVVPGSKVYGVPGKVI